MEPSHDRAVRGTTLLLVLALSAAKAGADDALLRAEAMTGNGTTVEAIPLERVRELPARYGRAGAVSGKGPGLPK